MSSFCSSRTPVAFQLLQMSARKLLAKCNFPFCSESLCIWAASITFGFSSTLVFNSIIWKNIVKSEGAPDTYRDNKLNLTNYFVRWKLAHVLCIFRDRLQLCLEVFNVWNSFKLNNVVVVGVNQHDHNLTIMLLLQFRWIIHRITQWFGLKETLKDHQVSTPLAGEPSTRPGYSIIGLLCPFATPGAERSLWSVAWFFLT